MVHSKIALYLVQDGRNSRTRAQKPGAGVGPRIQNTGLLLRNLQSIPKSWNMDVG